jgi:hypothetical protein
MIGVILKELLRFLTQDLITGVATDDPTRCFEVKIGALQDDPTESHCLISHHKEGSKAGWAGHGCDDVLGEIGPSNQRFTHNFMVRAKTFAGSLEDILDYMDTLGSRTYESLVSNYHLNGITCTRGSRTERVVAMETTIVTSYTTNISGGDTEWFGRVEIAVHYHTEVA